MRRNKKLLATFGALMISGALCVAFATGSNLKSTFAPKIARASAMLTDCRCGLIWGDGCSASNYGNSCIPSSSTETCSSYDGNCE
jgi:hypothetical protein